MGNKKAVQCQIRKYDSMTYTELIGLGVVGKGSWKDREVGKFLVGENFPTYRSPVYKEELGKNFPSKNSPT